MAKIWQIKPRTESDLITELLKQRGVIDQPAFLRPDYRTLHDPWQMKMMKPAIQRLVKAIAEQEPIGIFGDYDHDGTPGAALLSDGISRCGGQIKAVYIPTREEGYSISQTTVDHLHQQGVSLLVMVDCGITNKPEVDYAKSLGIDCLVIDHHIVQEDKYPDQAIVINPKQKGDKYPFKELCGCGLAFKVIQALGQETGKIGPGQLKWYLDLVAISTLCDMVPLVDENRILVYYGLVVLRQTRRLGLQKLLEVAAIDKEAVSTYTVGFGIGPRLNAPGRMEKASIAYDLLLADDPEQATTLAQKLNRLNQQRQAELDRVLKEAEAAVIQSKLNDNKVILVAGDGWADGVVGLVAGRLTEKYGRPTLVLSKREDGLAKGSARSIEGFHLVKVLQECGKRLVKYGGHARAAGLTLEQAELENFYDQLTEIADRQLTEDTLRPTVRVDAIIQEKELTLKTVASLHQLEPHGFGNPRPILMIERAEVVGQRLLGAEKRHVKWNLQAGAKAVEAIGFNLAATLEGSLIGQKIDLVGSLEINEWQGRRNLQFKCLDWRLCQAEEVS